MNNTIYSESIKNYLINDLQNIDIQVFDSIDSTNTYLKKICNTTKGEFTTIISNEQINGRGRLGRTFFSPANTGIYMSFEIKPDILISNATFITTATSVAVCRAIENVTKLAPKIKWINDIYIDNKKVCGILAEAVTDVDSGMLRSIIIGIGINVSTSQTFFPTEIKEVATSLNVNVNKNELIASILNEFYFIYKNFSTTYMEDYKERSLILGKNIYYIKNGCKYYGIALDFTDNGGLIVKHDDDTIETLTSGEISLRLI